MSWQERIDEAIAKLEPAVRAKLLTPPNDAMRFVVTPLSPNGDDTCDICGADNLRPRDVLISSVDKEMKIDLRTIACTYVYVVCRECREID